MITYIQNRPFFIAGFSRFFSDPDTKQQTGKSTHDPVYLRYMPDTAGPAKEKHHFYNVGQQGMKEQYNNKKNDFKVIHHSPHLVLLSTAPLYYKNRYFVKYSIRVTGV